MVTSYQNFIGIDIGKFKNVVAVHKQKSVVEFDNNASGWQQLFKKFSDILSNSFVTLENTGKYELGLSHFLIDKNIAVHRANTRKVKSFILSHGTLAKSRCKGSCSICAIELSLYLYLLLKNNQPWLHFVNVVMILHK